MDISEIRFSASDVFQRHIGDLDTALRASLDLLIRSLRIDRVAVFLLDEKETSLRARQIATVRGEMEGEGESLLLSGKRSSFSVCLNTGKPVVCPRSPEYSVYVPLLHQGRKIGVLRADNGISRKPVSEEQSLCLAALAGVYSTGIGNILSFQSSRHHVDRFTTMTRISNAIGTTLRLGQVLELALSSLVKDLGYDRAQIFLLDEGTNKIRENMSIDFRGYFRTMEDVSPIYPLFDSLLTVMENKPSFLVRKFASQLIAYMPVHIKGRKIGLLIVDNLFTRQPLTSSDLSFLGILTDQLATIIENSRLFERVEKLSITDSLTGLFNHRYFYERLSEEIQRANRFGTILSLLMLDIDHFKKFNDTFGHQAGDAVLSAVTRIIQDNIRAIDVASRYGGEEIAIILPGTDIDGAKTIAERIREGVKRHNFYFNQQRAQITVSIGLVCYPADATERSELVRRADMALYWVKNNGRDATCAYSRADGL